MRTKSTRWLRAGLAISAAWALIVIAFTVVDYVRVRTDGSACAITSPDLTQFSVASRHTLFDRYESRTFSFEQAKGHEHMHDIIALRSDRFAVVLLLPLCVVWVISLLIRWVVYGFRTHTRTA